VFARNETLAKFNQKKLGEVLKSSLDLDASLIGLAFKIPISNMSTSLAISLILHC